MSALLDAAALQARIDGSPFNCSLGLQVDSIAESGTVLRATVGEAHIGDPRRRSVHGGVLAALIDVGGSYSIIARSGQSVVTIDLRVDYHRPAFDAVLLVRPEILRYGRRLATVDTRILDAAGRLLASGRSVYMHTELGAES